MFLTTYKCCEKENTRVKRCRFLLFKGVASSQEHRAAPAAIRKDVVLHDGHTWKAEVHHNTLARRSGVLSGGPPFYGIHIA